MSCVCDVIPFIFKGQSRFPTQQSEGELGGKKRKRENTEREQRYSSTQLNFKTKKKKGSLEVGGKLHAESRQTTDKRKPTKCNSILNPKWILMLIETVFSLNVHFPSLFPSCLMNANILLNLLIPKIERSRCSRSKCHLEKRQNFLEKQKQSFSISLFAGSFHLKL